MRSVFSSSEFFPKADHGEFDNAWTERSRIRGAQSFCQLCRCCESLQMLSGVEYLNWFLFSIISCETVFNLWAKQLGNQTMTKVERSERVRALWIVPQSPLPSFAVPWVFSRFSNSRSAFCIQASSGRSSLVLFWTIKTSITTRCSL